MKLKRHRDIDLVDQLGQWPQVRVSQQLQAAWSMTHYDVLEISPKATFEVIRAAYRSLCAKYHPDKDGSPEAKQCLQSIQDAYQVLSDPTKRAAYDCTLDTNQNDQQSTAPDIIVMRLDGTSSFLTLSEHIKRGGKELADCDLTGLNLSNAALRSANLKGAKLDGGCFQRIDLQDADLTDCSAKKCDFQGAKFSGAKLAQTDFTGSSMIRTTFYQVGSIIKSTTATESSRFTEFDNQKTTDQSVETGQTLLKATCFKRCDLRDAKFVAPNTDFRTSTTQTEGWLGNKDVPCFTRQTYQTPDLRRCEFSQSNLDSVDLHGINLESNNFRGANLHQANLIGVNIAGLDLTDCNLVNVDLHKARYTASTQLPEGYRLPDDAIDLDQQRIRKAEEDEKKRKQAQRENRYILITVAILFISLVLISPAAFTTKPQQLPTATRSDISSFLAWTEPVQPKPGTAYQIVIEVRLPSHVKQYTLSDLTGTLLGSDGYSRQIPFDRKHQNGTVYIGPDEERHVTSRDDTIPVRSNRIQLAILVPGAPTMIQDIIQIRSQLLNEEATIKIKFTD